MFQIYVWFSDHEWMRYYSQKARFEYSMECSIWYSDLSCFVHQNTDAVWFVFWWGSFVILNWPVKQVFLCPCSHLSPHCPPPNHSPLHVCLIPTGFFISISGGNGMRKMRMMTMITLFGVWSLVLGCKCPLCVLSLPLKHQPTLSSSKSVSIPAALLVIKELRPPGGSVYSVMNCCLLYHNTINCFELSK